MKDKNNKNKLSSFEKFKIKIQLAFLNLFGRKKEAKQFRKRLMDINDVSVSLGAESFGLYGLADFEYDTVYSQMKIDNKYKYIWITNISGGVSYEGGGVIYIHNNFRGTLYAPNSCIYIRKSIYGLIESENSKILVRGNNAGYIHNPRGEVLIGGINYGYIYAKKGKYVILKGNPGITKGEEKILKPAQKKLLLGLKEL